MKVRFKSCALSIYLTVVSPKLELLINMVLFQCGTSSTIWTCQIPTSTLTSNHQANSKWCPFSPTDCLSTRTALICMMRSHYNMSKQNSIPSTRNFISSLQVWAYSKSIEMMMYVLNRKKWTQSVLIRPRHYPCATRATYQQHSPVAPSGKQHKSFIFD